MSTAIRRRHLRLHDGGDTKRIDNSSFGVRWFGTVLVRHLLVVGWMGEGRGGEGAGGGVGGEGWWWWWWWWGGAN